MTFFRPSWRPVAPARALLVVALLAFAGWGHAATQTFSAEWIQASVLDDSTPALYARASTAPPGTYQHQYYSDFSAATLLHVADAKFGNAYANGLGDLQQFTPVSNTLSSGGGTFTITTVVAVPGMDLQLTQQITHTDGNRRIGKRWSIENTGDLARTDLRLIHFMDTFFGGDDSAKSFYDSANSMVYLRNNNYANWGIMGFNANPATPAASYFGGHYSTGLQQARAGQLDGTVNPNYVDAGYGLQWNRDTLAPGETWVIESSEVWTEAGQVQVLAPADQIVEADSTATLSFTVQNLGASPIDIALSTAASGTGWTPALVGASARTISADSAIVVEVDVAVPADAAGTSSTVTLTADGGVGGVSTTGATLGAEDVDVAITPSPVAFGSVQPGSSAVQTVTITNNGVTPATLDAVSTAAPFTVSADLCSSATLPAGGDCTLDVTFTPTSVQDYAGSLQVTVTSPLLVNLTADLGGSGAASPATVGTDAVSAITANGAMGGGNVSDDGGAAVTGRGIAYNTAGSPTLADQTVAAGSGIGSFSAALSGLSPGTLYYVRAYAVNSAGTAFGNEVSFTSARASQTIDFPHPGTQTWAVGGTFAIAASASSGLAVVFSTSTPAVCTVSGTTVTMLAPGVCTLSADQAGNATWLPAAQVTHDVVIDQRPSVVVEQAAGQSDPANAGPILFSVVFSEPVTGFDGTDVVLSGSAGASSATLTGSGANYSVAVGGMTADGIVTMSVPENVAVDAASNGNMASTSADATVAFDATAPSVAIEQAAGQADPANAAPILFTVVFSEPVSGFDSADLVLSGSAGASTATVSGSGANYAVAVSGMSDNGSVSAAIPAGAATDAAGNANLASSSNDNSIAFDASGPIPSIGVAPGQANPTAATPILFTVVFSEPVTGFDAGDVQLSGSASPARALVDGAGASYTVAVSGMLGNGTVTLEIASGAAIDASGNASVGASGIAATVRFGGAALPQPTMVPSLSTPLLLLLAGLVLAFGAVGFRIR